MIIGVKYCGGCMATYNRGNATARIREFFPEDTFCFIHAVEEVDVLLVVAGCPINCAHTEDYKIKYGKVYVYSEAVEGCIQEIQRIKKINN